MTARRDGRLLGCVVLAAVLAVPSLAAGAGPTGDRHAIALFRAAARVTDALPAVDVTQSGYVRITDTLGPTKVAHWAWGWDQYQPGYRPVVEHLVLVQRGGRTLWLEDTLVPVAATCHGNKCAQLLALQLLITRTEAFYGIVSSGSSAACFTRIGRAHVPYVAGAAWWAAFGSMSSEVHDGSLTEITSRFASDGQRVTESDWIATTSRRFARTTLSAARGGGHAAYAYADTDREPKLAPTFPTLTLCS